MLFTQQYQGFGGPDKGFAAAYCQSITFVRSAARAEKMWWR
jgi:hypothetical protein